MEDSLFTKSTTAISVLLALLAGAGMIITPNNVHFILIGVFIIISFIVLKDKFNQLDQNTEAIYELTKRLNMTQRLEVLEKELSEQKGKLSVVLSRK